MRKSTLLWLTLAAVASTVLFHTSQKVNDGRSQLAQINKNIQQEEESLRVLQAEWSYLNQPERLEKLASQYLPALEPQKGRQFMQLAELKDRMVEPAPEEEKATTETAPVAVAADEAPRGDATVAAEAPVTEVEAAPEEVAVEAAKEAASAPVNAFASEYRAAGPRKDIKEEEAPEVEKDEAEKPEAEEPVPPPAPVKKEAPKQEAAKKAVKAEPKKAPAPAKKAAPPAVKKTETKKAVPKPAASSKNRNLDDVIKGLGVQ